jgi:hypothetical protein
MNENPKKPTVNGIIGDEDETPEKYFGATRDPTFDEINQSVQDEKDLTFALQTNSHKDTPEVMTPLPALSEDGFLCALALISDKDLPIELLEQYWEDLGQTEPFSEMLKKLEAEGLLVVTEGMVKVNQSLPMYAQAALNLPPIS